MLRIKNWNKFQHYRMKNGAKPPWLKLHRALLDDFEFHALPIEARANLPMLWLLAAENDGEIVNDIKKISFRLRQPVKEIEAAINSLISIGFIELYSESRVSLDSSYSESRTEGEENEIEKRGEDKVSPHSPLKKKITFDSHAGTFCGITKTDAEIWEAAYPAIDLGAELNKAAAWLMANPKNKKSNYGRFLTNWFSRSQDRAGTFRGNSQPEKKSHHRRMQEAIAAGVADAERDTGELL